MKEISVILNLTQHTSTEDQKKAGVIDLPQEFSDKIKALLTFNELPNCDKLKRRAIAIKEVVLDFLTSPLSPVKEEVKEDIKALGLGFMIGGAPFFMSHLEKELKEIGTPLYAFSKRVSQEVTLPDGSIEKKMIFKHEGFVPSC